MSNCQECGEEIAEIDTFCPYCGISLKPVIQETGDGEAQEDSQNGELRDVEEPNLDSIEETIAINNEDILELNLPEKSFVESQKTEDSAEFINDTIKDQDNDSETEEGELTEVSPTEADQSISTTDTDQNITTEEEEIPKEKLLFTARSLDTEVAKKEAEKSFDIIPENDSKDASEAEKTSLDEPQFISETETKSAPVDADQIGEEQSEEPGEQINFDQTLPYYPKNEFQETEEEINEPTENSKTESASSEVPEVPHLLKQESDSKELDETSESKAFDKNLDGDVNITDQPIAPPPIELSEPEEVSKFDSVKIMERNTAPPDSNEQSEDLNAESEVNQPSDSVEEHKTFTTPNIGQTATDGKKSKLQPLEEGTILNDRYEIIRKIGGGGMGAVYLASDKNLGGVLRAVKEMVQSYIEEEQQDKAINDFKRESLLLTSLEHPSIPTIYDYFFDEKEARFYLVMKYINGGDLSSRLRAAPKGRIDEETVTKWGMQVADVLNYLHNRQPPIVYRDLKPANIMIDGNSGRVMLIDFGIARWINKEEKGVTAVGTMGYAPPELFSGNVEPSSDIYSLGSTMFHLLTGSDPQNNPLLIFDFQKNPKPREINPQISDQMERIIMKMVEYNADKRFSSAIELKEKLEKHLEKIQSGNVSFGVKKTPAPVSLKDEKVFCGFCGQKIVASDLFCAFCGAKQPIASKGVHSEDYVSAPITAKLVIMGTNELEPPSYKIEKDDNLVGRRDPMSNIFPEVDLSKYDPQTKISRRHARIWREGNNFMIEDLGSSNGTILIPVVNDTKRLTPKQPNVLTNGDKIKLGDTTLHFVIG